MPLIIHKNPSPPSIMVMYVGLPSSMGSFVITFACGLFIALFTCVNSRSLNTVFHEYLAGIIFSEFVILEISRVFNLAIPKNRAG